MITGLGLHSSPSATGIRHLGRHLLGSVRKLMAITRSSRQQASPAPEPGGPAQGWGHAEEGPSTAASPPPAAAIPAAAEQPAPTAAAAPAAAPAAAKQPAAAAAAAAAPARKKAAKAAAAPSVDPSLLGELQAKGLRIAEQLGQLYPDPPIPLDHASHFQLLCAVLLSAQTTDKKVNEVTPELFRLAPDAAAMAALEVPTIESCIRQLGLAPTKAKNLKAMSQMLLERHAGVVPDSFEALEALPGVGHKTASVVMAQAFGRAAFPVDTHIHRLAQRWGLTAGHSVEQTEADLKLVFPERLWRELHLQIIFFGREACPARSHDPAACPICSWAAVPPYDRAGASPLKPGQRAGGGNGGGSGSSSPGGGKRGAKPVAARKKVEGAQAAGGGAKRTAAGKGPRATKKQRQ